MSQTKNQAFGAPGVDAKWTTSSKSGLGKAINTSSQVAFSLSHGILNEIYYPREDIACTRDMEFLVTNDDGFFSEEKRNCDHTITMTKQAIPAYKIINSCQQKRFVITKEIIADPYRSTILQKINFKSSGRKKGFHIYALLAPHLNNHGGSNNGWTGEYNGMKMLFAESDGLFLAMACSCPWLKRSVGYVGSSDGWIDIHDHKKMEWEYAHAPNGNIALTGEIDMATSTEFLVAISFGRNAEEAANNARSSLLDGFDSLKKAYEAEWEKFLKKLKPMSAKNNKISACAIRIHESRTFPGGVIASLSIPWGESKGDQDTGGYHLVWPRDLAESAGALIAQKSFDDANRIVNYLMSTQKADGSWPQNMWLEGKPHWKGLQMDQTAFPILVLDLCMRNNAIDTASVKRYWPGIKKAIAFLIHNGPYTSQDRWEEEPGYTPFTIAVCIAAMLAGANVADENNEKVLANICREIADSWNDQIETWTYVTGTALAKEHHIDGYYIRLNPDKNIPADQLGDRTINLQNHYGDEGVIKLAELISVDALALVRFGLRAPDDPKILNTIKVIDALLQVDTPSGPCWHRYNNDGYGEHANGDPYDGTGIGRAWPLLTGERGHYEIAAGNVDRGKELLNAIDEFANNGLISEQIWDTTDIPEKELFFGKHSGSAMPLTWAHAEYVKLCASLKDKKVFDMPPQTKERYLDDKKTSDFQLWRFNDPLQQLPKGKNLRILTQAAASIRWTDDGWQTKNDVKTAGFGLNVFSADIKKIKENASKIEFTFYWEVAQQWENKNFSVDIGK